MIKVRNLKELRYHLIRINYSIDELIELIESHLMIWFINDYSKDELIEKIKDLTFNFSSVPDNALFI